MVLDSGFLPCLTFSLDCDFLSPFAQLGYNTPLDITFGQLLVEEDEDHVELGLIQSDTIHYEQCLSFSAPDKHSKSPCLPSARILVRLFRGDIEASGRIAEHEAERWGHAGSRTCLCALSLLTSPVGDGFMIKIQLRNMYSYQHYKSWSFKT